jgi:hypothetical protein
VPPFWPPRAERATVPVQVKIGNMLAAKREACRRFLIVVAVWASTAALWSGVFYFSRLALEANPRSPLGFIVIGLFVVMLAAWITVYWYVFIQMRSICPNCKACSARLSVKWPSGEVWLDALSVERMRIPVGVCIARPERAVRQGQALFPDAPRCKMI